MTRLRLSLVPLLVWLSIALAGQQSAPTNVRLVPVTPPAVDYFIRLQQRPNVVFAHPLASQPELDRLTPRQKPYDPVTQKKRPVVYDSALNAFRFDFHPVESTDTQQLWPKLGIAAGESALIAFDLRLSPEMAQRTATDWNRHKAQQLDGPGGAPWLTLRTFYDAARNANQRAGGEPWRVAYWVVTANNGNLVIPSRLSSTEYVEPRKAEFYVRANTWARITILVTDLGAVKDYTGTLSATQRTNYPDGRVMALSYWQSDEQRDPVQILDRALVLQPYAAIDLLRFEWDTGADNVPGDDRYSHAWQRNVISIRNPTDEDLAVALERPAA